MKKFKIEFFWNEYRPYIRRFTEFSKTGNIDGTRISFLVDGRKCWQEKFKNDLLNGIGKDYYNNAQNDIIINFKKNIKQGIEIIFYQRS